MTDITLPPLIDPVYARVIRALVAITVVEGDWNGTPHWRLTARLNNRGYGGSWDPGIKKQQGTHRISHRAFKGPIPEGYEVDHLCRLGACWNPEHLEAVTPEVNWERSLPYRLTETCPNGHVREDENTVRRYWSYRNRRICLICRAAEYPTSGLLAAPGTANARGEDGRKTHCLRGHPMEGANVKVHIKADGEITRTCQECRRTRQRERRRARRALGTVSYTHLDVYKRQVIDGRARRGQRSGGLWRVDFRTGV